MKKAKLITLTTLTTLLIAGPPEKCAAQAVILGLGSQIIGDSSTPIGIAWREASVTKTNDIDGDNIFGTEGYYLPKTVFGPGDYENYAPSNFNLAHMTSSAVSWLGVTPSEDPVNNQMNYGYRQFQDPNNPASKISVGYMGRRFSGAMTIGDYYPLYDFTVGVGIPGDFAITIPVHPEFSAAHPSALRLTQIAGSGSMTVTLSVSPPTAYSFVDAEFITFRVNNAVAGDVFRLFGQATDVNNLLINGMMFDVVPIPEPDTALALALIGLLAMLVLRMRARSAARQSA